MKTLFPIFILLMTASAYPKVPFDVMVEVGSGLGKMVDAEITEEVQKRIPKVLGGIGGKAAKEKAPHRFKVVYTGRTESTGVMVEKKNSSNGFYYSYTIQVGMRGRFSFELLERQGEDHRRLDAWSGQFEDLATINLGKGQRNAPLDPASYRKLARESVIGQVITATSSATRISIMNRFWPTKVLHVGADKQRSATGSIEMHNLSPWPVEIRCKLAAKMNRPEKVKKQGYDYLLYYVKKLIPDQPLGPGESTIVDFKMEPNKARAERLAKGKVVATEFSNFTFVVVEKRVAWQPKLGKKEMEDEVQQLK